MKVKLGCNINTISNRGFTIYLR